MLLKHCCLLQGWVLELSFSLKVFFNRCRWALFLIPRIYCRSHPQKFMRNQQDHVKVLLRARWCENYHVSLMPRPLHTWNGDVMCCVSHSLSEQVPPPYTYALIVVFVCMHVRMYGDSWMPINKYNSSKLMYWLTWINDSTIDNIDGKNEQHDEDKSIGQGSCDTDISAMTIVEWRSLVTIHQSW